MYKTLDHFLQATFIYPVANQGAKAKKKPGCCDSPMPNPENQAQTEQGGQNQADGEDEGGALANDHPQHTCAQVIARGLTMP